MIDKILSLFYRQLNGLIRLDDIIDELMSNKIMEKFIHLSYRHYYMMTEFIFYLLYSKIQ